jgi:ABC-type enterochelin transport system permease subunit
VLPVFLNIMFVLGMVFHVWETRKFRAAGRLPSRFDYIYAAICGILGAMMFATVNTNPVEAITDTIIGLASMGVCVWSFTLYKRLRWEHGL